MHLTTKHHKMSQGEVTLAWRGSSHHSHWHVYFYLQQVLIQNTQHHICETVAECPLSFPPFAPFFGLSVNSFFFFFELSL